MTQTPLRYKKLLAVLPKNNYDMSKSAQEAGFSKSTATKQSKRLLAAAIRSEAREILRVKSIEPVEAKKFMTDIIGLSSTELFERLKYIATQSKDLSSALKVLVPLATEFNVKLNQDESNKVIVPVLNVTMTPKSVETDMNDSNKNPALTTNPIVIEVASEQVAVDNAIDNDIG